MAAAFRGYQLFLLILLISIASVSGVLFTPALPQLAKYFAISDSQVQWTMSLYLLGYAIGPLPYGPLANRFGRKKAIFMGLCLALIGTVICLFATSFLLFCLGRLVQALGTVAGFKIAFTMIGDRSKEGGTTKTLSYILFAAAAAPPLGVALGGFLTSAFGWRGCFVFLLAYVIFLTIACRSLPETAESLDRKALQWDSILQGFMRQFKNSFLCLNTFIMGIGTSITYVFATMAPHIAIEKMQISTASYGLWNILPLGGIVLGFYTSSRLAGLIKPRTGMLLGLVISLVGVIAMIVLFIVKGGLVSILFVPMLVLQAGYGITYTSASGQVLAQAQDKSNTSAVMQFITMGIATLMTLVAGAFLPSVPLLLAILFGILILLELYIWIRLGGS